jgi:RimJ/RimL family protein N-acetyltransferase
MIPLLLIPLALIALLIIIIVGALVLVMEKSTDRVVGGAAASKSKKLAKCALVPIVKKHKAALLKITSDTPTMRDVADGNPWDAAKVDRFIDYSLRDQKVGRPLYWGIEDKKRLVGVVGIHPVSYFAGSTAGRDFVTIFLSPAAAGKGCGTAALKEALRVRWERSRLPVYADIKPGNKASVALHKKLGFVPTGVVSIKGCAYQRVRADAPPPAPYPEARPTILVLGKQLRDSDFLGRFPEFAPVSRTKAEAAGGVTALVLEGASSWDRKLQGLRSEVRSRLDAQVLTNKILLHDRLAGTAGIVPPTTVVAAGGRWKPSFSGDVLIWRPEGGYSGRGIYILESPGDLNRIWKMHSKHCPRARALLTKYISNPKLTSAGHKFHLRMYFVVGVVPPESPCFKPGRRAVLCAEGDIALATAPYVAGQYRDKNIHDTHVSTGGGLRFPDDYPGGKAKGLEVQKDAVEMLGKVMAIVSPEVVSYVESRGGYEIYGVDFMVDDTDKLWLIEVNSRPGYALTPKGIEPERQNWISTMLSDAVAGVLFAKKSKAIPV